MSRVLLVCAHPDDECLGAGGTLAKHVAAGDDVAVLILCGRSDVHREAAQKAADAIGYRLLLTLDGLPPVIDSNDQGFDRLPLKELAESIKEFAIAEFEGGPEVVYLHSPKDLNQDHQRAAHATLIACRPSSMPSVRELLAFEVPSSSEWGTQPFAPTLYVELTPSTARAKDAAWECYAQLEGQAVGMPRNRAAILARESWRGSTVGVQKAEAFEVLRMTR
jgi:LmbE family N-acetylglucosaminyl deacetylase